MFEDFPPKERAIAIESLSKTRLRDIPGIFVFSLLFLTVTGLIAQAIQFIGSIPFRSDAWARKAQIVLVVLILGQVLFALRKHRRVLYGYLEVSFATAVAWEAAGKIQGGGIAQWSAIVGAIYLVVRGIDNVSQGNEARRKKLELTNQPTQSM